jgi:hypothetical protein
MDFFKELVSHLTGNMSAAYLSATMIFILIGALLNIGLDVMNRDEKSTNTPVTFSWTFFALDNLPRFAFNIMAAYSVVRFFSDIFPGLTFGLSWAWVIGLVFDWIWVALRELKFLAQGKLNRVLENWRR